MCTKHKQHAGYRFCWQIARSFFFFSCSSLSPSVFFGFYLLVVFYKCCKALATPWYYVLFLKWRYFKKKLFQCISVVVVVVAVWFAFSKSRLKLCKKMIKKKKCKNGMLQTANSETFKIKLFLWNRLKCTMRFPIKIDADVGMTIATNVHGQCTSIFGYSTNANKLWEKEWENATNTKTEKTDTN